MYAELDLVKAPKSPSELPLLQSGQEHQVLYADVRH